MPDFTRRKKALLFFGWLADWLYRCVANCLITRKRLTGILDGEALMN